MLITEEYRYLNAELHRRHENYGTSGQRSVATVQSLISDYDCKTLLDYGCGKQTLTKNLTAVQCYLYDPAIEGLEFPKVADIVTCTDVMEHVEPELVDDVLDHLFSFCKKVSYFVICGEPCTRKMVDGTNAHRTVESKQWWIEKLIKYGELTEMNPTRENVEEFAFLVEVRD